MKKRSHFISIVHFEVCVSPGFVRQRKCDPSPVCELRRMVDAGGRELGAARHARQTGLHRQTTRKQAWNPLIQRPRQQSSRIWVMILLLSSQKMPWRNKDSPVLWPVMIITIQITEALRAFRGCFGVLTSLTRCQVKPWLVENSSRTCVSMCGEGSRPQPMTSENWIM